MLHFALLIGLATDNLFAQDSSGFGFSLGSDYFNELLVNETSYSSAKTVTYELSFYDYDYTRLEYSLNHTRGYNSDISYSYGFSAAYILQLSPSITLKPGIGIDGFKMIDRQCKSVMGSFFRNLFNTDDQCIDDVHASFMPFLETNIQIAKPLSVYLKTGYRTFLSSVHSEVPAADESPTDIGNKNRTRLKSDHSFYGSGLGFGAGLRIDF